MMEKQRMLADMCLNFFQKSLRMGRVPTDTSLERGSYLEVVLDAKIYGDMKDILYHTCDAQQKQVLVVHISNC